MAPDETPGTMASPDPDEAGGAMVDPDETPGAAATPPMIIDSEATIPGDLCAGAVDVDSADEWWMELFGAD